ncbi:MAG: hypothetical protein ACREIB_06895, partial [Pseudomonadota bacterium]
TVLNFQIRVATAELTSWILMPYRKEYRDFRIVRFQTESRGQVEAVKLVSEYLSDDSTVIAFKLLALKPGYTYEVSWSYK